MSAEKEIDEIKENVAEQPGISREDVEYVQAINDTQGWSLSSSSSRSANRRAFHEFRDKFNLEENMANNKMWLVNEVTGQKVFIGKYYPNTGWYVFNSKELAERIDEAFHRSDFGGTDFETAEAEGTLAKGGQWGNTDWKIVYENVAGIGCDDTTQAKIDIVEAIQKVQVGG